MEREIDRRRFLGRTATGAMGLGLAERSARPRARQGAGRRSGAAAGGGLGEIHRAVDETLATGRLGRPVFVRYSLQGLAARQPLVASAGAIAALVRRWVGQPVERVVAVGSEQSGQVAATLLFASGESAVVSCGSGRGPGSGLDLMIVGSRGVAYHDGGAANLWDQDSAPDPGPPDPALAEAIRRSLASGRPEPGA